ncbi:polysaccharide deacetylase family protein [Deinococcus sp. A31D244]|uniref:polysaccharide deacetylase family protein n=1 Tax=Deinococcus sp. A31D244 TaxID=3397675 RepID=UPI0039E018CE
MTTLKGHPDVPAGTALNVRLIWDVPLQGAGRGLSPKHRDATYDWNTGKYMDGQAELTFPHPRVGQNDNALRGPLVAVYTIGTGPLSQTARYPLQAYETAAGELDITVDPNPATVVAAQTLIDLITGADVARTQAEEAAQRVNDAILDLSAERQAVADSVADTAQSEQLRAQQQSLNNTQAAQAAAAIYQAATYAYTLASTGSLASISNPQAGQTALIFTSGDVYQYAAGTGWGWIYNLWDAHNVKPNEMLVRPRNAKRAAVTFVMDDGPVQDYTVVRPILNARGVKGSFAVIAANMRAGGWDQYRTLQAEGHEVMSHSLTHLNQTTLTPAALDNDMRQSRDLIRAQGLRCDTYVYPYNANNAAVRAACRKYYRGAASGGQVVHTGKPLAQYAVARYGITNTGTLEQYKAWVDAAKAANGWIVILIHAGYDLNATQQGYLDQLLVYIAEQGVAVVPFGQGLDMFGNVLDGGDTTAGLDSDGALFGVAGSVTYANVGVLNALGDGTPLTNDTPPSAFPQGKISWYVVDVNTKPGFTTGSASVGTAGTLMVSRVRNNSADAYANWDRQVFYEYNNNKIWTRRAASQSAWTAWTEVGASGSSVSSGLVVQTYNYKPSTAAYTEFPDGVVTVYPYNSAGQAGWPGSTAGTVYVDRSAGALASGATLSWIRQTVYHYGSDAIWQRRVSMDGTWTAWVRIDAASVSGVTAPTPYYNPGGAVLNKIPGTQTDVNNDTPITAFPFGRRTVIHVNNRMGPAFTTGAAVDANTGAGGIPGTLEVYRDYDNGDGTYAQWERQVFWEYGNNRVWTRRPLTTTTWSAWERLAFASEITAPATSTTVVQPVNYKTATAAYTEFASSVITVYPVNAPGNAGFPTTAGTVYVDRTSGVLANSGNLSWVRQTFYDFYSDAIWQRRVATDGTWTAWSRNITTVSGGAVAQAWASVSVPAGAAVTQAVTVAGAVVGDNVVATPDTDLELGLIAMSPKVTAAGTVTLRIYNHTGAAINTGARNWKVMVIR